MTREKKVEIPIGTDETDSLIIKNSDRKAVFFLMNAGLYQSFECDLIDLYHAVQFLVGLPVEGKEDGSE